MAHNPKAKLPCSYSMTTPPVNGESWVLTSAVPYPRPTPSEGPGDHWSTLAHKSCRVGMENCHRNHPESLILLTPLTRLTLLTHSDPFDTGWRTPTSGALGPPQESPGQTSYTTPQLRSGFRPEKRSGIVRIGLPPPRNSRPKPPHIVL
jgi:hypothetical protein